jgi:hypothetical protein
MSDIHFFPENKLNEISISIKPIPENITRSISQDQLLSQQALSSFKLRESVDEIEDETPESIIDIEEVSDPDMSEEKYVL